MSKAKSEAEFGTTVRGFLSLIYTTEFVLGVRMFRFRGTTESRIGKNSLKDRCLSVILSTEPVTSRRTATAAGLKLPGRPNPEEFTRLWDLSKEVHVGDKTQSCGNTYG